MARRFALAVLVLLVVVSTRAGAQALPMSGTVINYPSGTPVAGAHVVLMRSATHAQTNGESVEILAQAQTDERGQFSFGPVTLKSELSFPLETGVSLRFVVSKDGRMLGLERVSFTAPREDAAVVSVAAELYVR